MCKTMRAVAVALVVAAVGLGGALALGPQDNPFSDPPTSSGQKASHAAAKSRAAKGTVGGQVSAVEPSELEQRIEQALAQRTTMNFTEAELGEVIAQLKRDHDIEIQLDKQALEEMDLGSDTMVTCVVKDVSLRSALRIMLRPLELTYIIRDEVLLITSQQVAEENRKTIVYDVADLVTYRDEKGDIWIDHQPLIDVVATTVEPDSWMEAGGNGAILGADFASVHVLVVKTTEEIQAEVASVLKAIRGVVARTPGDGQPPLRLRSQEGTGATHPQVRRPVVMGVGAPAGGEGMMGGLPPGTAGAAPGAPATGPAGGTTPATPASPAAGGMGGGFMNVADAAAG
jgi:hypothetical protein